jgi:ABC-type nitrate/sulfonate/bicarbonate transport system substrate-binding protein
MRRTFFIILLTWIFASNIIAANEKVTLQLRWDHQFQFAGYYAAKWQGYYEEEGLDVVIKGAVTPKGILSAIEEVDVGRAQFGIGAADILMAKDKGIQLVVLASIFQHSASAFYTKKETQLYSPTDFLNLKVARKVNDLIDIELQAMLKSEGINPDRVKAYPYQSGMDHLISGEVDVVPAYSIAFPFEAKKKNLQFKTFRPIQYGIDFYGDSLFAQYAFIKKDPKMIKRFVKASLKGWEYALNHREQIAKKITETLPRTAEIDDLFAFNMYQSDGIAELMNFPEIEPGHINPARWEKMHSYLKAIGVLKNPIKIDEFIFNPEKLNRIKSEKVQKILISALVIFFIGILLIFFWVVLLTLFHRQKNKKPRCT